MRFLKRYKDSFEQKAKNKFKSIEEEIVDILIPLGDSNIKYTINPYFDDHLGEINITFRNCRIVDIKDEVLQLSSYLSSEEFVICQIEFEQEIPGETGDELHKVTLYELDEIEEADEFIQVSYIIFTYCIVD